MTDTIEVPLLIASATDAQITTASEKAMNEAFFACVEREALILGRGILPASPVLLEFPSKTKIATMIDAASKNLATSRLWAVSTNSAQPALSNSGGQFYLSGDGNSVAMGVNPWGLSSLVWLSSGNDAATGADGGWNKGISPLDHNFTYVSIVFVRRTSDTFTGNFYHGCGQAISASTQVVNTNPYFIRTAASKLLKNDWHISIGFIYGKDVVGDPLSSLSGMYNLRTGDKIVESGYGNYRHDPTVLTQKHRSYLNDSTDQTSMEWCEPIYQLYDGISPDIYKLSNGLLNKPASTGGNSANNNLITVPIITGATGALAGQSVTLTAAGSAYLWGGSTGITYRWTKNGVITNGATLSVGAGETASVIAIDANGNTSPAATRTIAVSTNSPPNIDALAHTLPARLTLGSVYNYILSGATDTEDASASLTYNVDLVASSGIAALTTVSGTNGTQRGFTISPTATAVSLVVYVTDSMGAESARKTFTWDASKLDAPYMGSGVLTAGTYTVNVPAGSYTIIGRGGLGSSYQEESGGGCSGTYCYDSNGTTECTCLGGSGADCGCDPVSYYTAYNAGAQTLVMQGETTLATINGSAATAAGYNVLPALTTVVKTAATAITLTITVAANGGQCEILWG